MYLLPHAQGYDVEEFEPCTELDVLEGNVKALQATLHTAQVRVLRGDPACVRMDTRVYCTGRSLGMLEPDAARKARI